MIKIRLIDFFDTIMYRKVSYGIMLEVWAKYIIDNFKINISTEEFVSFFRSSEHDLKKMKEPDLNQILEEQFRRLELYKGVFYSKKEEFMKLAFDSYISIEIDYQEVNKKALKTIADYKEKGDKVIIVSDFYLGKEWLEVFLKSKNILKYFDEIYVSCDYNMCKSNGTIYDFLLNKYKGDSYKISMEGDNKYSDYKIPKYKGITVLNKWIKKHEIRTSNFYVKGNKEIKIDDFAYILNSFCEKLYSEIVRKEIKEIYFMSREGFFLKSVFEQFLRLKGKGSNVVLKDFMISRHATYILSYDIKNDFKWYREYIGNHFAGKSSVKSFLEALDFQDEDIVHLKSIFANMNFDEVYELFEEDSFIKFIRTTHFREKYDELYRKRLGGFKKYIEYIKISNKDKIYICDVGWNASMQDFLHTLLKDVTIEGYYYGLDLKFGDCCEKNIKNGVVFFNYPYISEGFDWFRLNKFLIENLFMIPMGSVARYTEMEPYYELQKFEENNLFNIIKPVQDRILGKLVEIVIGNVVTNELNIQKQLLFSDNLEIYRLENAIYTYRVESFNGSLQGTQKPNRAITDKIINILKLKEKTMYSVKIALNKREKYKITHIYIRFLKHYSNIIDKIVRIYNKCRLNQ